MYSIGFSAGKSKASIKRPPLSLGDLIATVRSFSKDDREATATVATLFESGKVRICDHGRAVPVRVVR